MRCEMQTRVCVRPKAVARVLDSLAATTDVEKFLEARVPSACELRWPPDTSAPPESLVLEK